MRSLALLALAALAALPLSAHDHWRDRRPVFVVEDSCRPVHRWEQRRWDDPRYEDQRWEDRWERHAHYRRYDCDDGRVILRARPLAPPFQGRIELRFR
jgi:hypothetical protein